MARSLVDESTLAIRPPSAVIFDVEPGHYCFAYYRNVSFVLWYAAANESAVQRLTDLNKHLTKIYPQGHSSISCVRQGVGMPDDAAREAMARLMDGGASQVRCASVIYEGEGFWVSALRSTLTQLGQRNHYALNPTRISLDSSISEAALWLAGAHTEATGLAVTPSQLERLTEQAFDDMRASVTEDS